jgi:hypothetical protein
VSRAPAVEPGPALTRSYEDLRRAVIDGVAGERIDRSVMLDQGMWAWIELVASETMRSKHDRRISPLPSPMTAAQPSANRSELVSVWTDLLLGRLAGQEMT